MVPHPFPQRVKAHRKQPLGSYLSTPSDLREEAPQRCWTKDRPGERPRLEWSATRCKYLPTWSWDGRQRVTFGI